MAILPPTFRQRYFSAAGLPLSGGKLFTYQAGTVTPLVTYTDATETSANTNPIILDANGECDLWLGGFAYKIVLTDSGDVVQWTQDNVNQGSINNAVSADLLENLGITVTPGGSATISVKTGAGNIPSISEPVRVGFRGGSLASGLVSLVNITSPLAMNLTDGGTLGHVDGVTAYVYVYLINNNGVAELAVSSTIYQENALVSTTAMSSAADSNTVIYSTVARSNVPIRLIARVTSTQVTAGSWIAAPTEIQTGEEARRAQISTNAIADLAVTTAKLADNAATRAKTSVVQFTSGTAPVGNVAFSGSATGSAFTTTLADISGLTVTITTKGGAVLLWLEPDGSSSNADIVVNSGTTSASGVVAINRGGSVVCRSSLSITATTAGGSLIVSQGPGSIRFTDRGVIGSAGTYVYKIQAATLGATSAISFNTCVLMAMEL